MGSETNLSPMVREAMLESAKRYRRHVVIQHARHPIPRHFSEETRELMKAERQRELEACDARIAKYER